MKTNKERNIMN